MPHTLFAYLDPGTGSIVIQAVAGAVVGASFAVKTFWGRIKGSITRKPDDISE